VPVRRRFRLRGNEFPCRSTGGTAAGTARTGAGRCGGATGRLFASDTFAPFLLHLPVVLLLHLFAIDFDLLIEM